MAGFFRPRHKEFFCTNIEAQMGSIVPQITAWKLDTDPSETVVGTPKNFRVRIESGWQFTPNRNSYYYNIVRPPIDDVPFSIFTICSTRYFEGPTLILCETSESFARTHNDLIVGSIV